MINCYQFKELISSYIDGEVSYHNRILFEDHIKSCSECSALYESVLKSVESMRNFDKVRISDNFMAKLRDKILADRVSRIQASQKRGLSLNRIPSFVYGFAAAVLVVVIGFFILRYQQSSVIPASGLTGAKQQVMPDSRQVAPDQSQYRNRVNPDSQGRLVSKGDESVIQDSVNSDTFNRQPNPRQSDRSYKNRMKMVKDEQ